MRVRNRYSIDANTMSTLITIGIDIKTHLAGMFLSDMQTAGVADLFDRLTLENFDVIRDVDDGSWVVDLVGCTNGECQLVHNALTSCDISSTVAVELVE